MNPKNIPKKEAIKFGFGVFKNNVAYFAGILLILILINFTPQLLGAVWRNQPQFFIVILTILLAVVRLVTDLGLIRIGLKFADSQIPSLSDLYFHTNWRTLLNYFIASILYNLMVVAGIILLIVPGIYLSIRFQYYGYLIVDKNLGPIEALNQSSHLTSGVKWQLFLFGLILGLINLAGLLALVVGLFVTIPSTMVAGAYVFRLLQKRG